MRKVTRGAFGEPILRKGEVVALKTVIDGTIGKSGGGFVLLLVKINANLAGYKRLLADLNTV